MGAAPSRKIEDTSSLTKMVDHPVDTSTVSTGFHVLEVHMPSVGLGWMSLVFLGLGALFLIFLYRKCSAASEARNRNRNQWRGHLLGRNMYDWDNDFHMSSSPHRFYDIDRFQELNPQALLPAPMPDRATFSGSQPRIQASSSTCLLYTSPSPRDS